MSDSHKNPGDTAEKSLQLEAEALAVKAQAIHKKVEAFEERFVALGRQQLTAAIEAGKFLLKAKEILGHGNFTEEQKRWRQNETIKFSDRSGRRYMLLAAHADDPKLANVANIKEAEKCLAAKGESVGTGDVGPFVSSVENSLDAVEQCEAHVLSNMRRLGPDKQRSFLEGLVAKLNERLNSLPE